jgi:hypothetical protein
MVDLRILADVYTLMSVFRGVSDFVHSRCELGDMTFSVEKVRTHATTSYLRGTLVP